MNCLEGSGWTRIGAVVNRDFNFSNAVWASGDQKKTEVEVSSVNEANFTVISDEPTVEICEPQKLL